MNPCPLSAVLYQDDLDLYQAIEEKGAIKAVADASIGALKKVGEGISKAAGPMAESLEAEGWPPKIAKGIALVAATDAAMPVTVTSTVMLAVQGPAAMANPLYWTPGGLEAAAIITAAKMGPRAARALSGIMARRREAASA